MNHHKLSEFVYTLDLEHLSGHYGVWDFKTFYTRAEALDYAEKMAANNPEISVRIEIRPRFVKKNVLKTS